MKKNIITIILVVTIITLSFCAYFLISGKYKEKGELKININTQGSSINDEYKKIFDTINISNIHIDVDKIEYNNLIKKATEKEYIIANSFKINDVEVKNIGIKTKGDSSLTNVKNEKYSYIINFSKYVDGQNLYGLDKLALNSIYEDPTLIREYLSYYLLTEMDVYSSHYMLVNLYINNEYKGLFFAVESIDKPLAQRLFKTEEGTLYKPEGNGSDLVYNSEILDKLYKDGNFEIKDYKKFDKSEAYKSYSGLFKNIESGYKYGKNEGKFITQTNELFIWLKELNDLNNFDNPNSIEYKERVEKIINVPEVLKYFAVNDYIMNNDNYLSNEPSNYGLYLFNKVASIIPWDYNDSFGTNMESSVEEIINYSVLKEKLDNRPLINVLLRNDEYKKQYMEYLMDCNKIFVSGGNVFNKEYQSNYYLNTIDKFYNIFSSKYEDFANNGYKIENYNKSTSTLKELIKLRSESINNQVNNINEKVTSNINISDLK